MSVRICCADVGPDCDFEALADTEEELMELVAEHASRVHGIETVDAELESRVRDAMQEV